MSDFCPINQCFNDIDTSYILYNSRVSRTDPVGVDRVAIATHHELYSFIIFHQNCFQIQSQEHRFSQLFSWEHACPRSDPLAIAKACQAG